MPGNLLFADTTMPSVTGDTKQDIKRILNHMYMLQEELRYTLGNLSGDNFNDTGLVDLSGIVTADLSITVQSVSDVADGAAAAVITIQGDVSDQGAELTLIAGYTGQDDVVTIATTALWAALTPKVTTTVYYVTQEAKYKKYNGTAWVDCNNISEASFTLSAINGQSAVSLNADRINFTGFTTFVRPDDLSSTGTTTIDGGRINTNTINANRIVTGSFVAPGDIYTTNTTTIDGGKITTNTIDGNRIITNSLATAALEAVDGPGSVDYIAVKNGLDFRNPIYIPIETTAYSPWNRSIQGVHSVVFFGDAELTAGGLGDTDNELTSTASITNQQTASGTITQSGLLINTTGYMQIYGQYNGNASASSGIRLSHKRPELSVLADGQKCYELVIDDTGITAWKYTRTGGTISGTYSAIYS